jgi:hypothetical protein
MPASTCQVAHVQQYAALGRAVAATPARGPQRSRRARGRRARHPPSPPPVHIESNALLLVIAADVICHALAGLRPTLLRGPQDERACMSAPRLNSGTNGHCSASAGDSGMPEQITKIQLATLGSVSEAARHTSGGSVPSRPVAVQHNVSPTEVSAYRRFVCTMQPALQPEIAMELTRPQASTLLLGTATAATQLRCHEVKQSTLSVQPST